MIAEIQSPIKCWNLTSNKLEWKGNMMENRRKKLEKKRGSAQSEQHKNKKIHKIRREKRENTRGQLSTK